MQVATPGLVAFTLLGVVVLLVSSSWRLRRHMAVIAPATLGVTCAVLAAVSLGPSWQAWRQVLLPDRLVRALGPGSVPAWLALGAAVAVAARLAFLAEGGLLRLRRRRPAALGAGLPPQLASLNLTSRDESMRQVERVAQRSATFWTVSLVSLVGEELLYRGAMLADGLALGLPVAGVVALQAGLYALNHVGFGWRSMLGKALLGLALGAAAWLGGIVLTIGAHTLYQCWVSGQFARSPERSPHA